MENWINVKGFEGLYMVSDLGRIKSLSVEKYNVRGDGFFYKKKEKILTPRVLTKGYLGVVLYKNKKTHAFKIHRLVAINFISNEFNKDQVNHKDGNKNNNTKPNLEWATNAENMQHSLDNGFTNQRGENNAKSKLSNKDVLKIIKSEGSYSVLAKKYNVSISAIQAIIEGRSWRHLTKGITDNKLSWRLKRN